MLFHTRSVRLDAGKQFKTLHRLEHIHCTATQRTTTQGSGGSQPFSFNGKIHHVGNPQIRAREFKGDGHARTIYIGSIATLRISSNRPEVWTLAVTPLSEGLDQRAALAVRGTSATGQSWWTDSNSLGLPGILFKRRRSPAHTKSLRSLLRYPFMWEEGIVGLFRVIQEGALSVSIAPKSDDCRIAGLQDWRLEA
ncbi:hypothetical protein D3C78_1311360 [compost metagenome]